MSDERLALTWHWAEFCICVLLLALSVVGLGWAIKHQRPHFIETKQRHG